MTKERHTQMLSISRICEEVPSQPILINFCTGGLWSNIINFAEFRLDRSSGLGSGGTQNLGVSIGKRSRP
jgi:hypothetical protein